MGMRIPPEDFRDSRKRPGLVCQSFTAEVPEEVLQDNPEMQWRDILRPVGSPDTLTRP